MPFIPHTSSDIARMLHEIGVTDTEDLFDEVPPHLLVENLDSIPAGVSEMEMMAIMSAYADENRRNTCFIGAGSYDHHIPAAVWDICSRGEFLTAYTPYQAEASQGGLQVVFEFQTMMTSLTGMDVANASVYDGATALAEAILMAVRAHRRSRSTDVLVLGTPNPFYLETAHTLVSKQGIRIHQCPTQEGTCDWTQIPDIDPIAVIIQQPNFFGQLDDVDEVVNWAHAKNALVVAVVNPTSLALLHPPGQWGDDGADIVCGDGQPLGIPMAYGGPSFGFICTKSQYVRQMPGRIVGKTIDLDGCTGYTLTLQAREQHIRRAKATSNICTNQGLLVTAATVYMSLMGVRGLHEVARTCRINMQRLLSAVSQIEGVKPRFNSPYFHEVVLDFEKSAVEVENSMLQHNILAGFPLSRVYPDMPNSLLVCTTERRGEEDIVEYVQALRHV